MKVGPERFAALLLNSTPWIDVRAPVEFAAGHIPGATNLPLLNDDERHSVGIAYKQTGREAAIELGHQLVSGANKAARLQAWRQHSAQNEQSVIYCFRGGMRSQIVQAWLGECAVSLPVVAGGYKALRRFLLEVLTLRIPQLNFSVVSGPTGSGKTTFLNSSGRPFIDLEELAAHRGSAFGRMDREQPSQADFENALALKVLALADVKEPILIENESRLIGLRVVPEILFQKMKASPRHEIFLSLDDRVENIFRDYILQSSLGANNDPRKFVDFRRAVAAISRRLGGARAQEILDDLTIAQGRFAAGQGLDSNRVWIRKLLQWYYDPLYRGQGITSLSAASAASRTVHS